MSEKSDIVSKLIRSKKSRDAYTRALINTIVPAQIRALRFKNEMTQKVLAREADMKQSRISTMERPGATQFNVETLIRLASALKLGLKVEFVPFSEMLRWENGFNSDAFNPVTIDKDTDFQREEAPAIGPLQPAVARTASAWGSEEDYTSFFSNLGSVTPTRQPSALGIQ
jgi:transcriptional regulator with XRE-family HTH domain